MLRTNVKANLGDASPRQLLRIEEVAQRLAISRSMAWRLTAEGRLPVVRIGRAIRVRPADLEAYIEGAVR